MKKTLITILTVLGIACSAFAAGIVDPRNITHTGSNIFSGTLRTGIGTNLYTVVDSGNIQTYAPTPPVYLADGITTKKTGNTFSVANWIPNNLTDLYTQFLVQQGATSRGLLDGPGYLFNDQNGILPALSTNQVFETRWYKNKVDSTNSGGTSISAASLSISENDESYKLKTTESWNTTTYTVSMWVWTTNSPYSDVWNYNRLDFSFSDSFPVMQSCPVEYNKLYTSDGIAVVYHYVPSESWIAGRIYHIGITISDNVASQYCDGVFVQSSTGFTSDGNITPVFGTQGGYGGCGGFYGLRLYAANALSDSDMVKITGSLTDTESVTNGLTRYWKSLDASLTNMPDVSGNSGAPLTSVINGVWTNLTISTGGIMTYTTNSMSLVCTNKVLDFLPTSTWMSILANGTGLTTDDVQGYVSPDYGTNWYQASLVPQASIDLSNTLFQGTATYTNNASSSNMVLKAVTTSNKVVKILGMWGPSN